MTFHHVIPNRRTRLVRLHIQPQAYSFYSFILQSKALQRNADDTRRIWVYTKYLL
jgi:hypothetical protein